VAKNSGNLEASRTLNVHEETIGALHKTLELVCAGLRLGGRIQEIDRHFIQSFIYKSVLVGIEYCEKYCLIICEDARIEGQRNAVWTIAMS
jgi:hypothetical protein